MRLLGYSSGSNLVLTGIPSPPQPSKFREGERRGLIQPLPRSLSFEQWRWRVPKPASQTETGGLTKSFWRKRRQKPLPVNLRCCAPRARTFPAPPRTGAAACLPARRERFSFGDAPNGGCIGGKRASLGSRTFGALVLPARERREVGRRRRSSA